MSRIFLVAVNSTISYDFGDPEVGSDIRSIPDMRISSQMNQTASLTDLGEVRIHVTLADGRISNMLFVDFGILGPGQGKQHYLIEVDGRDIGLLKSSLGGKNVDNFIKRLRKDPEVRLRADELGLRRVLDSEGDVVNMAMPLVTAGFGSGSDLDLDEEAGETPDNLPTLPDL